MRALGKPYMDFLLAPNKEEKDPQKCSFEILDSGQTTLMGKLTMFYLKIKAINWRNGLDTNHSFCQQDSNMATPLFWVAHSNFKGQRFKWHVSQCSTVCLSVLFPQMPVLIAATVASDKPTDGYLVKDIISILTSGIHSTNSFSSASVPILHCLGMKRGRSIDSKYTCMEGESSGRTCFWNCIWTCAWESLDLASSPSLFPLPCAGERAWDKASID